jgi:glutathione peroxidase
MAHLANKYGRNGSGLRILAFPCSQFGNQELATSPEIKQFVSQIMDKNGYHSQKGEGDTQASFSILEKIDVNGPKTHKVYKYLKSLPFDNAATDITWNFGTYWLFGRGGEAIKRADDVSPKSLESEIEELLSAPREEMR